MVATGGVLVLSTKPSILYHKPAASNTYSYDFDGMPAKILSVRLYGIRAAGRIQQAYLAFPGEATNIRLCHIQGETVADPATDGESMYDEINICLTVPAGTILYWESQIAAPGDMVILITFNKIQ